MWVYGFGRGLSILGRTGGSSLLVLPLLFNVSVVLCMGCTEYLTRTTKMKKFLFMTVCFFVAINVLWNLLSTLISAKDDLAVIGGFVVLAVSICLIVKFSLYSFNFLRRYL